MESAFLCALLCVPAVAALAGWLALPHHRGLSNASLWGAQGLVAAGLIFISAISLPAAGELHAFVTAWMGVADVFVALAFQVNRATAVAMWAVWGATVVALWRVRHMPSGERLRVATTALQAPALATLMFDALPTTLAAWALVGLCCEVCERVAPRPGDTWQGRFALNRGSDVLGVFAILILSAASSTNALPELQGTSANDLASVTPLVLLCLLAALGLRVVAVFWAPQDRVRCVPQALVVVFCGAQVVWRVVAALAAADRQASWRFGLVGAIVVGALLAWQLRKRGPLWRWVLSPLAVLLTLSARAVVALESWIFDGLFLQAPAVVFDAGARLQRVLQGGDVQRYVGIGLVGFGGLVYVATRPAAAPELSVRTDGLTVRVQAGRGATSSQRLEFDYDFDGDQVVDRRAAGPSAAYTYAVAGTYSLTVTVRDPFWHTQRSLRELVKVQP